MNTETLPQIVDVKGGLPSLNFSESQVKLIRDTVAKGTDENEFALFLYTCKHLGLNPLLRQIHAVKRWDSKLEREAMALQVGIDGYRLIAERTKNYAPGREPTFVEQDGKLVSATAYIQKRTEDGTWHEVAATAYYAEYVQTKKDGTPNSMWAKMPHSQTAKCAEALAIRKAFPNETAGVKTEEEMDQADSFSAKRPEPIKDPIAKNLGPNPEEKKDEHKEGPLTVTFVPISRSVKKDKNGHDRYAVKSSEGIWYSTGNEHDGALMIDAGEKKQFVVLEYVLNGDFRNIVSAKLA